MDEERSLCPVPSRKREEGFTLIEMMVALAVFSLAAMALIRLEGATIRSTGKHMGRPSAIPIDIEDRI